MNTINIIFHIMRADFYERTRRYSFLMMIICVAAISYIFIPPLSANYITSYVKFNGLVYRGAYNSAWLGSMMALATTVFLSLFGFYLVKDTIKHDYLTGVFQIIKTTSVKKMNYIIGKVLSNFFILLSIILVAVVSTIMIQLIRAEVLHIKLWSLLSPFIFIVVPAIAIVAVVAVTFETIPLLNGSLGNVIYFFLWLAFYILVMESNSWKATTGDNSFAINDVFGMTIIIKYMLDAARNALTSTDINFLELFGTTDGVEVTTFYWDGITWTKDMIVMRIMWIGIAILFTLLATFFFKVFNEVRQEKKRFGDYFTKKVKTSKSQCDTTYMLNAEVLRLGEDSIKFSLLQMTLQEIRLCLKEIRWWWFVVMGALILCGLCIPIDTSKEMIVPITLIWPISIWSSLGVREKKYNTYELIFTCPNPIGRQFTASWIAGIVITLLAVSGIATQFIISGAFERVFALVVGSIFVPTLALMLTTWSGISRFFEIIYTIIWYFGPLNKLSYFDYSGTNSSISLSPIPIFYLIMSGIILALAYIGRRNKQYI